MEIEDIRSIREELGKKYENGLPDYLVDYFDNKEKEKQTAEYYKEAYRKPKHERIEFCKTKEKEFWEKNRFEIIKKEKRVGKNYEYKYEEPERNEDRKEEVSPEEIKLLIAICEKDLYLFAIRYFSHYLSIPSSKFHKYLYNFLSDNINKRRKNERGFKHAIAAPRSGAKSTIVSTIFPLWCIAYNKKRFIIIVSNTLGQAADFLTDIKREIEHNELLKRDFPHISGKGSKWKIDEIITSNEIKVLALGTGSQIRSRRFGVYRPDLIIGDDIESSEMIRSKLEREFIREEWFNKDFLHAHGAKGSYTDILVIGTILGSESLLYALLNPEEYPDWTSRKFQSVIKFSDSKLWDEWEKLYKNKFDRNRRETARAFFKEHEAEMLEGTEVLWPEGDPYYDLMIEKISDYSSFLSEKQNESLDPSRILVGIDRFRFENFRYYKYSRIIENKNNPRFGALDPSLGKKSSKGDYSCIITLVKDLASGYIFVLDISLQRRSVNQQIQDILKYHERYLYKLFGVETNAFQIVLADNLRKESRKRGFYVPVQEMPTYVDKKIRFEPYIPLIEDGTVVFDRNKFNTSLQYSKAIEQLSTFKGDGTDSHDDAVDAFSMAMKLTTDRKFKLRTKPTKK